MADILPPLAEDHSHRTSQLLCDHLARPLPSRISQIRRTDPFFYEFIAVTTDAGAGQPLRREIVLYFKGELHAPGLIRLRGLMANRVLQTLKKAEATRQTAKRIVPFYRQFRDPLGTIVFGESGLSVPFVRTGVINLLQRESSGHAEWPWNSLHAIERQLKTQTNLIQIPAELFPELIQVLEQATKP